MGEVRVAAGANLAARTARPPTHGEDNGLAYTYQATERVLAWTAKRAYRRARTRAAVHGSTTYQGATHTARSLNAGRFTRPVLKTPARQAYRPQRALSCIAVPTPLGKLSTASLNESEQHHIFLFIVREINQCNANTTV